MKTALYSNKSKPSKIILIILLIVVSLIFSFVILKIFDNDLKYVYVERSPYKTEYYVNELISYDGIKIVAVYKNGEKKDISIEDCVIIGYDNSSPNENLQIIVEYENLKCGFYISIIERPQFPQLLVGIKIKSLPNLTEFKLGDSLDITGGILECVYSDGSTKEIPLSYDYIYGFKNDQVGEFDIIVKYSENGIQVQTSYRIKIID